MRVSDQVYLQRLINRFELKLKCRTKMTECHSISLKATQKMRENQVTYSSIYNCHPYTSSEDHLLEIIVCEIAD